MRKGSAGLYIKEGRREHNSKNAEKSPSAFFQPLIYIIYIYRVMQECSFVFLLFVLVVFCLFLFFFGLIFKIYSKNEKQKNKETFSLKGCLNLFYTSKEWVGGVLSLHNLHEGFFFI